MANESVVPSLTYFLLLLMWDSNLLWLSDHQLQLPTWHKPRVIWEEGFSAEDLPWSDWPVVCLWNIFLVVNWYRRVKPIVCGAIPRPVGLGYIGQESKRARRNKSVSNSIPPWFLLQDLLLSSCLRFPFLTKLHPSHTVYHNLRKTSMNIVSPHNFILYRIYFIPTYFTVESPLFTFIIEKFEY